MDAIRSSANTPSAAPIPTERHPGASGASGSVGAIAELVVERYKVEADTVAIAEAIVVIERYMSKLQALEGRLNTYLTSSHPTKAGSDQIKEEMAQVESLIEAVEQGVFAAMDAMGQKRLLNSLSYSNTGVTIQREGPSWKMGGLKAFDGASQPPVVPTAESIRMHKGLLAGYEAELRDLNDKYRHDYHSEESKGNWRRITWLNTEINLTRASIGEAELKLSAMGRYDELKRSYDLQCLELSTLKDNGVQHARARADELEKSISVLEASMKTEKAIIQRDTSASSA